LLFLYSWGVLVAAQNVSVSVETVNVRQQGTISFSEFAAGQLSVLPPEVDPITSDTDDHRYRIIADLKSVKPGRFGTFNIDLYVEKGSTSNSGLSKFVVTGTPVGGFLDSTDRISIHVLQNGTDSKGMLAVPLHNTGQVDLISTEVPIPLREISLGQTTNSEFKFSNKLENLKLTISDVKVEPECGKCWKGDFSATTAMEAAENQTFMIPVKLETSTFSALWASALKLKGDQAHDNLTFTIAYRAGFGGQPRSQRFTFPVRFSPSFWTLIMAVAIGLGLGFTVSLLLDKEKRASWGAVFKALGLAVGLSAVIEILALVLAAGGSKVVIFGFDLDPRQFLPTIVIAILVSGGPSVVQAVKSVFGGG
jgi:hypothetical protein